MNTNIYGDFQIYISVPLILLVLYYNFLQLFLEISLGSFIAQKMKKSLMENFIFCAVIHLVLMQNFSKKLTLLTSWYAQCANQGVINVSFCRNFAYILNAQSLTFSSSFSLKESEILVTMSFPYLQICLPKI